MEDKIERLTIQEVANELNTTEVFVGHLILSGQLPYRSGYINRTDLQRYLEIRNVSIINLSAGLTLSGTILAFEQI